MSNMSLIIIKVMNELFYSTHIRLYKVIDHIKVIS